MSEQLPPRPGDFGLSRIGGVLGWFIARGQSLTGDASRYTHAFVVIDDNTVIEAMPGGARITPLKEYFPGKDVIFSRMDINGTQQAEIVAHARSFKGVPYSFMDYVSITILHIGFRPDWIKRYVKNSGHMICSQLVDEAYLRSGVHLFDDGRFPGDVTPGDILYTLVK